MRRQTSCRCPRNPRHRFVRLTSDSQNKNRDTTGTLPLVSAVDSILRCPALPSGGEQALICSGLRFSLSQLKHDSVLSEIVLNPPTVTTGRRRRAGPLLKQPGRRCAMSVMTMPSYIIRGGQAGRERLRLLARVMRPTTAALFARAGVREGMRCLDVGCGGGDVSFDLARLVGPLGRVVGIDLDAVKITAARAEATAAG